MLPRDCRSVDQLVLSLETHTAEWLHFWGHTGQGPGPWWLSQWWPGHPFRVDGVDYATAEHWMMAGKARLFQDEEMLASVLSSPTAKEAKAFGRAVRGFDSQRWGAAAVELVVRGNVEKFGQHEALRSYLLSTGDRVLVEASPRDRIWGIGMGARREEARDPRRWRGLNLLGFSLMEARARLI